MEFAIIPGDIQQKDLEKYIIDLLGSMNVKIKWNWPIESEQPADMLYTEIYQKCCSNTEKST